MLERLGSEELTGESRAVAVIDRFSPRLLVTPALIARGASLIVERFGGLYRLAAAHVAALLAGLVNAWAFGLVADAHKER